MPRSTREVSCPTAPCRGCAPTSPTEQEAKLLKVRPGAPVLEIERRCSQGGGPVIEFTRSRYRGDAYDFLIELRRGG